MSSHSDSESIHTTSTICYEQESFSTFSAKASDLIKALFPAAKVVNVERMTGGGYNRIIGVELSNDERYVLRIPRIAPVFEEVADQVALLRYLKNHSALPVPHVLHFDITDHNPLGWSYVLQRRIDALPLSSYMADLASSNWKSLTDQVANITSQMCSTTFPSIGILRAKAPDDVCSLRFALPLRLGDAEHDPPSTTFNDTLAYLEQCFDIHTANALFHDPNDSLTPSLMTGLKNVAVALAAEHLFSNRFSLFHEDHEARNSLVTKDDSGRFIAQAILDFDGALAAPIEAAWPLPHWLWTWDEKEEEGILDLADAVPESKERLQIKEYFEQQIERLVPGFMNAWRRHQEIRELLGFAVHGISSNEDQRRVEKFLRVRGELEQPTSSEDGSTWSAGSGDELEESLSSEDEDGSEQLVGSEDARGEVGTDGGFRLLITRMKRT